MAREKRRLRLKFWVAAPQEESQESKQERERAERYFQEIERDEDERRFWGL